MPSSLPTFIARITLFAALVVPAVSVFGQVPVGGSSARDIPTAVQQSEEQVAKVIAIAEDHFRKGDSISKIISVSRRATSLIGP